MSIDAGATPSASLGVLGVGAMGGAIARALAAKGLPVLIANSRGPETLTDLAAESEFLRPVTIEEAGQADIVILTVPWVAVEGVLGRLSSWEGRILVDASNAVIFLAPDSPELQDPANPLAAMGLKAADTQGRTSSELVRELAPGARVVKTFNHIEPPVLAEPRRAGGQSVVFLSGDDASANTEIAALQARLGLFPVDLGALSVGAPLTAFPGGPLLGLDLLKP
ncbi:NADPH-dependent F420 reductase [Rathayibacter sp. VKM Ac-2754]|uniref:NADPH-dependent F420 reductase n=1 Tax=Rathayibacter sp. VKM Ac-2754 TaxID=2609251 RepID=UPI00135BA10F|nr:NAD(P)-binding domain-containing protein [Rathayibacter sp. VKM Ac-2754]MWV60317.1 NADP oxidoreductase [Rathayibacter sp. VKM Ac-2754]